MILDNISQKTLITGVTGNVGTSIAEEFAKHGHALVISSPFRTELTATAKKLQETYGVEVTPVTLNLLESNAEAALFKQARSRGEISILVNNAGTAFEGNVQNNPSEWDVDAIHLNLEMLVRAVNQSLPAMLKRNTGKIVNVACMDNLSPQTHLHLPVYNACKAFIESYTARLTHELNHTGVQVRAVLSGKEESHKPSAEGCIYANQALMPKLLAALVYNSIMDDHKMVRTRKTRKGRSPNHSPLPQLGYRTSRRRRMCLSA